jgi:hypothetical protein
MNNDLAGDAAVWRALFGVRGRRFCRFICVLVVLIFKERRNDLRRIMGPSLETGTVFDALLFGELLRGWDCVSVMRVQEMCDEKGRS